MSLGTGSAYAPFRFVSTSPKLDTHSGSLRAAAVTFEVKIELGETRRSVSAYQQDFKLRSSLVAKSRHFSFKTRLPC